jgi:probable phosphoglycerate mutase
MEVLLIRHAIPIRRELESGIANPELAAEGLKQADLMAQYLASEKLHAIYASPMQRAQQTAQPLAAVQGLAITTVDGVAEYDKNSNQYVPVEELKAKNDPRWQEMLRGEWTSTDETEEEFINRTVSSIEEIITNHASQRVAIVCHGGVINAYICHVLGLKNQRGFFYPNYTSIHRIAAAGSGERSIVTLNETSHLRGTGLPMGLFQK